MRRRCPATTPTASGDRTSNADSTQRLEDPCVTHVGHHKDTNVCGTHREGQLLTLPVGNHQPILKPPGAPGPARRHGRMTTICKLQRMKRAPSLVPY